MAETRKRAAEWRVGDATRALSGIAIGCEKLIDAEDVREIAGGGRGVLPGPPRPRAEPAGERTHPHPRRLRGPPWPQAVRVRRPWLPPAHRPCRRGRARGPRWSGSTLRPRRGPNGGAPAHRVALGRVTPVLFLCCGGIALTPPLLTGWCEETL